MKLVYKIDSSTAPTIAIGTALTTGWADLPADGLISTTNGYAITVALVHKKNGQPLAAGSTTVVAKH